jgi:hypothetical protein
MKLTNLPLSVVVVVLLCLVTTIALRQNNVVSHSESMPTEVSAVVVQGATERGPVRMIRFVLLDTGVYPREMRINQGLINLAVEDETGISEGLVVERVVNTARERITTIRRMPNVRRGRELLRLTPGQYVVYDASKPNNKAVLIVEP